MDGATEHGADLLKSGHSEALLKELEEAWDDNCVCFMQDPLESSNLTLKGADG